MNAEDFYRQFHRIYATCWEICVYAVFILFSLNCLFQAKYMLRKKEVRFPEHNSHFDFPFLLINIGTFVFCLLNFFRFKAKLLENSSFSLSFR